MPDSHSARARWSSPIARAASSTVISFLAILVGLLTVTNPAVVAWVVGAIAALVAGVLAFFQAKGADRERTQLQEQVAGLKLSLTPPRVELLKPSDGDGSQDSQMEIRGRVLIQGLPGNAVASILKDRGLEIVPFVMPITTTYEPVKRWYSQNVLVIDEENGEFSGTVRIGTKDQRGSREDYRIILAILQKGYIIKSDETFRELPSSVSLSNSRTVSRLS